MAKETQNECPIHLISDTHPLAFQKLLLVVQEQEKKVFQSTTESHERGSQQGTRGVRKEIWSDRDVKGVTMAPG